MPVLIEIHVAREESESVRLTSLSSEANGWGYIQTTLAASSIFQQYFRVSLALCVACFSCSQFFNAATMHLSKWAALSALLVFSYRDPQCLYVPSTCY
ncbi:unnamed protein product [Somion occarium]|uniref:Uncharacterized protein n=1 Tax=Somion occarium TaxID=3059160 RepID=A0ABP1DH26_9APHY